MPCGSSRRRRPEILEEAGCADEQILAHLRGPDLHAPGCWALDLLLGKP
jgi:hypothetical protein